MKIKQIIQPVFSNKFGERLNLTNSQMERLGKQLNDNSQTLLDGLKAKTEDAIPAPEILEPFAMPLSNDVDFLANICGDIEINSSNELAYLMFCAHKKREEVIAAIPAVVKIALQLTMSKKENDFKNQESLVDQAKKLLDNKNQTYEKTNEHY